MSKDIYTKLPSESRLIRLLEVFPPDSSSDIVRCALQEVYIGADHPYKALSYAWKNDDTALHVSIVCDNQAIDIPANLCLALRRLRHPERSIMLWVDFLCINQTDDDERTHQVGMMREIYQYSSEVVIWLGERASNDDLGEWCLETSHSNQRTEDGCAWYDDERDRPMVDSYLEGYTRYKHSGPELIRNSTDIFGAFCLMHHLSQGVRSAHIKFYQTAIISLRQAEWAGKVVEALGAIIERPWWRRTWVVQETVLAQKATIYYSSMSAPWTMFSKAAANYARERSFDDLDFYESRVTREPLTNLSRILLEIESTRTEWISHQSVRLLSLLRRFRFREASDRRDKVFALLGLANQWESKSPILPDYSLNAYQVFWKTTTEIVSITRSLSILAGTLTGQTGTIPLRPSWITDWSIPPELNEFERLSRLDLYDASGGMSSLVRLHESLVLEVKGFFVDKIVSTGLAAPESGINRLRAMIQRWSYQGWHKQGRYVNPSDAFWRTICADTLYVGRSEKRTNPQHSNYQRADKSGLAAFRAWLSDDAAKRNRHTSFYGTYTFNYVEPEDVSRTKNSFHYAVECASGSRMFFVTESGYIGIGPSTTEEGDLVYVLLASPVPFVLRPSCTHTCDSADLKVLIPDPGDDTGPGETCNQEHFNCFSVVGDAYVHGVMDGETVRTALSRSIEPSFVYLV